MDSREFRNIAGAFATGVTVVTAVSRDNQPIGMTVNSFTSLSLDPPLVLFSVGDSTSLFEEFMQVSGFAVNILSSGQEERSRSFAARGVDRFSGIVCDTAATGSPILPDALGWFDCKTSDRLIRGDHAILIGEVVDGFVREGDPLVFYRGQYRDLK